MKSSKLGAALLFAAVFAFYTVAEEPVMSEANASEPTASTVEKVETDDDICKQQSDECHVICGEDQRCHEECRASYEECREIMQY